MAHRILEVSIANAYLKQLIESDVVLSDCWIQGEVSERFESRNGHVYFTLIDSESMLKSVIFRGQASRQRSSFQNGNLVVAHGRMSVYEQRSQYQFIADSIQPAGLGLQALQLELLRQKLEAEGLFDESRKRTLPTMPKTIGVVTSADGAVRHDIQNVLSRRFPLAQLHISPASVQGEGAPASLVAALGRLIEAGEAEVIIIGRGGGSAEDLMAFNDERVVRAIFASPVPVVSAVGHETDWTLADLVADLRAPTPSAAAELVSPSIADISSYIDALSDLGSRSMWSELDSFRATLSQHRIAIARTSPAQAIERRRPQIDHAALRIAASTRGTFERLSARMVTSSLSSQHAWELTSLALHSNIARLDTQLRSLEPRSVLQRGYAFVSMVSGGLPLGSVSQAVPGERAMISVHDGDFDATINTVYPAG